MHCISIDWNIFYCEEKAFRQSLPLGSAGQMLVICLQGAESSCLCTQNEVNAVCEVECLRAGHSPKQISALHLIE